MKINVYKGFTKEVLDKLQEPPIIDIPLQERTNVLKYDKKLRKKIDLAIMSLDDDETRWMTYDEYAFVRERMELHIEEDDLEVCIYRNNLLPDYYPIPFVIETGLLNEVLNHQNNDTTDSVSEECSLLLSIYSTITNIGGIVFGCYYNYEYEKAGKTKVFDYYPSNMDVPVSVIKGEFDLMINDDIDSYLRDFLLIQSKKPSSVSVRSSNTELSKRIEQSLIAYCQRMKISLFHYHETIGENSPRMATLIDIAKNEIGIPNFKEFRNIKFYKDPDISNDVIDVSQAQIITDIIDQAERAYDASTGNNYRDIFITAFTGAGKSVMFQIPAVYLARKYKKLTIIIEPVKSLMQDQKDQLNERGFNRVEVFNSDLITQTEKERVLQKVKDGDVDLLYLSPETLLSYSMDTIIGDREIGLIIVDEAHIVTTWGVGFRPDYWYLGGYINKIRHAVQVTRKHYQSRVQHFPICAFTATAVHSGVDDSVSDTIISLYMENPIKYIGYIKRDDIHFQIVNKNETKLSNATYEEYKARTFSLRVREWLRTNKKTVVYFPYASYAGNALHGTKSFADVMPSNDSRIGIYTGRNLDKELSREAQAALKKETFKKFKNGDITVMYATKAFGMGVDIDDIENVYHYAVTGNLSDYVQEIGRAARKKGMTGTAITDYYYNDISFMQRLFGMSQIRQFQIQKVLAGIYDVYLAKKESRNFLISPEAFTYIFAGKNSEGKLESCINQLKTCLLMLEKDLYDKFTFKVLISRPQSVFTKAYVVIQEENKDRVLMSQYGHCFQFVEKGRIKEDSPHGWKVTDEGDIYLIDLKTIWEDHYQNISFPQFKYWYFNRNSTSPDKVEIMPSISNYIFARQKVTVEVKNDLLLCDLREKILDDFEYITTVLSENFKRTYFRLEDFARLISKRFGSMTQARVIVNSLFDLVDPAGHCIKKRSNSEDIAGTAYMVSNGTLKELMKKPIIKSELCQRFNLSHNNSYSQYMPVATENTDLTALKLLSIFNYISYEVQGGENPEIFIRLNDPAKVRRIVMGEIKYSNSYVTKAKHKHERDVKVLRRFFTELSTDEERWNYIERYFLGEDVLTDYAISEKQTPLESSIDKHKSYPNTEYKSWTDIIDLLDDNLESTIQALQERQIPLPTYMGTAIKKDLISGDIIMSWPERNVLIFSEEISPEDHHTCKAKGWKAYDIYNLDVNELEKELR